DQTRAAARWPAGADGVARITLAGMEIVHVPGKRAAEGFDTCRKGQVIVSAVALTLDGDCELLDPPRLDGQGSLALGPKGWITARARGGTRLWSAQ
ncbi:competence protein, partial [Cribrihabitans sp. XS_ASV171]